MIFNQNRKQSRERFVESWSKHLRGETLDPLEKQIVDVIDEHPEYHALLVADDEQLERDYNGSDGQSNPYLHMGMHLALREQVGTNRPNGIAMITRTLLMKYQDGHTVEHMMMECLGEMLWNAQSNRTEPDEQAYLEKLKRL